MNMGSSQHRLPVKSSNSIRIYPLGFFGSQYKGILLTSHKKSCLMLTSHEVKGVPLFASIRLPKVGTVIKLTNLAGSHVILIFSLETLRSDTLEPADE